MCLGVWVGWWGGMVQGGVKAGVWGPKMRSGEGVYMLGGEGRLVYLYYGDRPCQVKSGAGVGGEAGSDLPPPPSLSTPC